MNAPAHIGDDVASCFRATMRRFPATVTIVTANNGGRDHGMTVSAVTSASMDPPSMLICLNSQTLLHDMLLEQASFAVNILSHAQSGMSDAFSGHVDPDKRFDPELWDRDAAGMLVLSNAHAHIVCRRTVAVPYGTHTVFIGEVIRASVQEATDPLLYAEAAYCVSRPSG